MGKQTRARRTGPTVTAVQDEPSVAAPRPSRPRFWLFAAGAVALSLFCALLFFEAAMRLFRIRPERYEKKRSLVLHEGQYRDYGFTGDGLIKRPSPFEEVEAGEYVPGAVFKTVYDSNPRGYFDPDNSVPNRINSLGMRGPEASAEKPPGTYRILGLGDSFTYGAGVRDEDTFLRRLETSLNTAGGQRYEVLNAGVEGYNTRDEVLYLEKRWLPLDPDLVLITFYLNDAYSEAAFVNEGQDLGLYLKPQGLARYSHVWDYLQHGWKKREESRRVQEFYLQSYFATPEEMVKNPGRYRFDWEDSVAALARARALGRKEGFRVALVVFPELYRLNGEYPFEGVHKLVARTAGALDIPVLDLLETFRGRSDKELWVHPSDHHPNETAHALAAGAIEKFLKSGVMTDGQK